MKTTPVWIASGLGMLLWLAGCSNDEPAMSGAEDSAASTEDSAASIEDSATSIEGAANTQADSPDAAPQYEVDPSWPRQLPNRWSLGQVSGIATDSQDNIWIIQRPRTLNEHEMGGGAESADARLLHAGAFGDCVQPGRRGHPRLGRADLGPGTGRMG